MPGWHKDTKQAVADGKLLVAGIAPEQHGDRMALFLQWKQMEDMIVMIDSYNVLELKAVPTTLLIDEAGIVRHKNPSRDDLQLFLDSPPAEVGSSPQAPRLDEPFRNITLRTAPLEQFLSELKRAPGPPAKDAVEYFKLGVAFRKSYDAHSNNPKAFQRAIECWNNALLRNSSNYICRRRIQQYGPQLEKPYPFYNWISQARKDITARGDTPHPLIAEPSGAEIASPQKNSVTPANDNPEPHPDPENKLPQDDKKLFNHIVVFVPHTDTKTEAYRVFVDLKPFHQGTKWNDEAGLTTLRPIAPPNWAVHPKILNFTPLEGTPPNANRSVDFELRRTKPADPFVETFPPTLSLQFFLHACHGEPEICEFLRLDADHEIQKWEPKAPNPPSNE